MNPLAPALLHSKKQCPPILILIRAPSRLESLRSGPVSDPHAHAYDNSGRGTGVVTGGIEGKGWEEYSLKLRGKTLSESSPAEEIDCGIVFLYLRIRGHLNGLKRLIRLNLIKFHLKKYA